MLAELLSGLGLLFVGLRLVGQHLRHASGHRVRAVLRTATASRWAGLLAGTAAGAVTQSSNAVTLITANLVHGRVLSIGQAAPVVAGANVGTALLVFLATLDMRLVVLYLVAAAGLAVHFKLDYHAARRDWVWAGLGLALLFMGLDFIKHAPDVLSADDWHTLLGDGISVPVAMLVGLVIALATQSASTSTILAVAGLHSGFLDFGEAFFIMTGANLGSGVAVLVSGSGLKGSGRQLCLVHVAVKLVGTALVLAGWLALEGALADVSPDRQPSVLAVMFLAMQAVGALFLTVLRDHAVALSGRLTPADPEEQASQPHYLYDRAVEDPVNAVGLAGLECQRLIAALPQLLPDLDTDDENAAAARRSLLAGHDNVASQIAAFLMALMARGPARKDLGRALQEQSMLENLQALQETLGAFGAIIDGWRERPALLFNLSEGLRTLVSLLADTAGDAAADADHLDLLIRLTGDRSEMLEQRRRQLTQSDEHDGARMQDLLAAMRLFERAVWLVHRMALAKAAAGQPMNG